MEILFLLTLVHGQVTTAWSARDLQSNGWQDEPTSSLGLKPRALGLTTRCPVTCEKYSMVHLQWALWHHMDVTVTGKNLDKQRAYPDIYPSNDSQHFS